MPQHPDEFLEDFANLMFPDAGGQVRVADPKKFETWVEAKHGEFRAREEGKQEGFQEALSASVGTPEPVPLPRPDQVAMAEMGATGNLNEAAVLERLLQPAPFASPGGGPLPSTREQATPPIPVALPPEGSPPSIRWGPQPSVETLPEPFALQEADNAERLALMIEGEARGISESDALSQRAADLGIPPSFTAPLQGEMPDQTNARIEAAITAVMAGPNPPLDLSLQPLKDIGRFLTTPLIEPETGRALGEAIPGVGRVTGPLFEAAAQITSPAEIAALIATAGAGPAVFAGTRGAPLLVRGAGTVIQPLVRGGFGRRVAAEAAVATGALLGAQEIGSRLPEQNIPTGLGFDIPLHILEGALVGGATTIAAPGAARQTIRAGLRGGGAGIREVGRGLEALEARARLPSEVPQELRDIPLLPREVRNQPRRPKVFDLEAGRLDFGTENLLFDDLRLARNFQRSEPPTVGSVDVRQVLTDPEIAKLRPGDRIGYRTAFGRPVVLRVFADPQNREILRLVREPRRQPLPAVGSREIVVRARQGDPTALRSLPAQGRRAMIERIGLESRVSREFDEAGGVPSITGEEAEELIAFIRALPDEYFEDVGLSIRTGNALNVSDNPALRATGGNVPGGAFDPNFGLIELFTKVIRQGNTGSVSEIGLHEISHNLSRFVPAEDFAALRSQFELEKAAAEIDFTPQRLGEQAPNLEYRFSSFSEWFAELMTDKALRDLLPEESRLVANGTLAKIRNIAIGLFNTLMRRNQPDAAERVYRDLLTGESLKKLNPNIEFQLGLLDEGTELRSQLFAARQTPEQAILGRQAAQPPTAGQALPPPPAAQPPTAGQPIAAGRAAGPEDIFNRIGDDAARRLPEEFRGKLFHGSFADPSLGRASSGDESGFFTTDSLGYADFFANSDQRNAIAGQGRIFAADPPSNPVRLHVQADRERLLGAFRLERDKLADPERVSRGFERSVGVLEERIAAVRGAATPEEVALIDGAFRNAALEHGKLTGKPGFDSSFLNEAVRRVGSDAFETVEGAGSGFPVAKVVVYVDRPRLTEIPRGTFAAALKDPPVPPQAAAPPPQAAQPPTAGRAVAGEATQDFGREFGNLKLGDSDLARGAREFVEDVKVEQQRIADETTEALARATTPGEIEAVRVEGQRRLAELHESIRTGAPEDVTPLRTALPEGAPPAAQPPTAQQPMAAGRVGAGELGRFSGATRPQSSLDAIPDEILAQEARAISKTHVSGLGMGQNEFTGTFLSTEAANRNMRVGLTLSDAAADIQKPRIFRSPVEYSAFREQFLPRGVDIDTATPAQVRQAAESATRTLQEQGFDSAYLPESDLAEGILVVFDRRHVRLSNTRPITSSLVRSETDAATQAITAQPPTAGQALPPPTAAQPPAAGRAVTGAQLPAGLRRSDPRFRDQTLQFESDTDKALYIVGNPRTKSKSHAQFVSFLKEQGFTDAEIRTQGAAMRTTVRDIASGAGGEVVIPSTSVPRQPITPPPPAAQQVITGEQLALPPGPERKAAAQRIQQAGQEAPESIPSPQAKFSHTETNAPNPGGSQPPPRPPRRGQPPPPDVDPFEALERARAELLPGERIDERLLIRHGAAIENEARRAEIEVRRGNQALLRAGLGRKFQNTVVPKDDADIARFDELMEALHSPSRVEAGEFPVRAGLEDIYADNRFIHDFEESARIDFDPDFALIEDHFYRGWKPPPEVANAPRNNQGKLVLPPGFRMPRVNATYREMRDAGFEPLFWNPYEQGRFSRIQGVKYREQMVLVAALKESGEDLIQPYQGGGGIPKGWRVPQVGPAFEGKPWATLDEVTGQQVEGRSNAWIVRDKTANKLENIYGKRPKIGTVTVERTIAGRRLGGTADVDKWIDWAVFMPKRAKLIGSFFQHIDFETRLAGGGFANAIDALITGRPIEAATALARIPKAASEALHASFSPAKRASLKKVFDSTEPLLKVDLDAAPGFTREGVHMRAISEAGLGLRDVTILPTDLDTIAREAFTNAGILGNAKARRALGDFERAFRNGLFDGMYPAAIYADTKNNITPMMARMYPHLTDAQLVARIAEQASIKYSSIPPSMSVVQNRVARSFLERVAFSFSESEGLLRGAARTVIGPNKRFWATQWLGMYAFLLITANAVHFLSTGEPLPKERYIPVSRDKWGPLPFSYRTAFAAPDIPLTGRNATELTVDLVGQMDTAFRVLDPVSYIKNRFSVPVRALINQFNGTNFFGEPIDEVGPGGVVSRTAQLMSDLFAPIGVGGPAIDAARRFIPGADRILPADEPRIGLAGQLAEVPGINLRAEPTGDFLDRHAVANFEGVTAYDDPETGLEPHEKRILRSLETVNPELAARQETSVARQQETSETFGRLSELDQQQFAAEAELVATFRDRSQRMTKREARERYFGIQDEFRNRRSERGTDFEFDTGEPSNDNEQALADFIAIFDEAKTDAQEDELRAKLEKTWTAEQKAYVARNTNVRPHAEGIELFIDTKFIDVSNKARAAFNRRKTTTSAVARPVSAPQPQQPAGQLPAFDVNRMSQQELRKAFEATSAR